MSKWNVGLQVCGRTGVKEASALKCLGVASSVGEDLTVRRDIDVILIQFTENCFDFEKNIIMSILEFWKLGMLVIGLF